MSRDEKIMLATMGFAVVLWVTGDAIGVSSVVAAMLGMPQHKHTIDVYIECRLQQSSCHIHTMWCLLLGMLQLLAPSCCWWLCGGSR